MFSLFSLLASLASFALDVEDVVRTLVVDVALLWADTALVVTVDTAVVSVDGFELDIVTATVVVDEDDVVVVAIVILVDAVVLVVVVDDDDVVDAADEVVDTVDVATVDATDVADVLFCGFSCVFCCCSRCSLVVTPVVNISIAPSVELLLFTCETKKSGSITNIYTNKQNPFINNASYPFQTSRFALPYC